MPADLLEDDVDPELAAYLRHTLHRVALTTPLDGSPTVGRASTERRFPRRLSIVAGIALAAATTAGVLVVSRHSDNIEPQDQSPPPTALAPLPPNAWTPPGTEITMTPTEPPGTWTGTPVRDGNVNFPIKPESLRWFDVPEVGTIGTFESIMAAGARIVPSVCTIEPIGVGTRTGAGVAPQLTCAGGTSGFVSSGETDDDRGVIRYDLAGIPEDIAFVSYNVGAERRWMRPYAGLAILAAPAAGSRGLGGWRLLDASGTVIDTQSVVARGGDQTISLVPDAPGADVSGAADRAMSTAFMSVLQDCLDARGADPSTGEYSGDDVAEDVWQACITSAIDRWHLEFDFQMKLEQERLLRSIADGPVVPSSAPEVASTEAAAPPSGL